MCAICVIARSLHFETTRIGASIEQKPFSLALSAVFSSRRLSFAIDAKRSHEREIVYLLCSFSIFAIERRLGEYACVSPPPRLAAGLARWFLPCAFLLPAFQPTYLKVLLGFAITVRRESCFREIVISTCGFVACCRAG